MYVFFIIFYIFIVKNTEGEKVPLCKEEIIEPLFFLNLGTLLLILLFFFFSCRYHHLFTKRSSRGDISLKFKKDFASNDFFFHFFLI
ncbi:hypothetical protein C7E23_10250 [Elizabethkingia anophelis]|nr:hypothetical protein C7E23_10250 [Elizabethkingia anophelis]